MKFYRENYTPQKRLIGINWILKLFFFSFPSFPSFPPNPTVLVELNYIEYSQRDLFYFPFYLSTYLSFYPSIHLSIYLSMYPSSWVTRWSVLYVGIQLWAKYFIVFNPTREGYSCEMFLKKWFYLEFFFWICFEEFLSALEIGFLIISSHLM